MNYDEMQAAKNSETQNVNVGAQAAEIPKMSKEKLFITIAAVVICLLVGLLVGYKLGGDAEIDSRVQDEIYKERERQDGYINEQKEELSGLQDEVSALKDEKLQLGTEISQAKNYQENKAACDSEIAEKTATIENLDAQISAKQNELDTLTGNIVKAEGAPKTLSAGEYTVGVDIPAGRYNVSGSRNFVAWDKLGNLKVNTILGNSSVGVGDYICTLGEGYLIECAARTTFTPIQ